MGVVSALVAAAVLSAPSAAADETEYLNKLQDRYEFLTPQQLLAEGQRVCAAEGTGVLSPARTTMVMNDLTVGANTALEIVSAAEWNLC
jgi:hypothetical protein